MKSTKLFYPVFFVSLIIAGCNTNVDDSKPIYGKESGLPVNCRAYIQVAIDSYRAKSYTAEDTMIGLERNCGANGNLWKK